MKKQEIIEALHIVLEALEGTSVEEKKEVIKEENVAKKTESTEAVTGELSVQEEELRQMKYADLKKLASEMGVSAKGKRDEIIARIIGENVEITVEEEDNSDNVIPFPKKDIDYLAMAKEATEDMSLDEIRETLEDLELDSTGKKKELIDRIAKAMEDGIIEIEDDDDVDEDEDEEVEDLVEEDDEDEDEEDEDEDDEDFDDDDDDDEEVDENTYFDVFDDGANDPDDVDSEERKKAMVRLQKEIINDYENEALQDSDIDDFLKKNLTEDELEENEYAECDEMDKFAIYCELMKRMIDDDGERISMGEPYEITVDGETLDYCCGHELQETDEGYVCEVCGSTYETEE